MKSKLKNVVEKLQKERQEYLALIDATKDLNFELYQKMVSAGETRTGALFTNENTSSQTIETVSKIDIAPQVPNIPPQQPKAPITKTNDQPLKISKKDSKGKKMRSIPKG